MGIKEIKELLEGLKLLGVVGAEVMADGQINSSDIGAITKLLTNAGVLVEAVKGIKEIPAELKDLDQSELLELGTILYQMVVEIKAAYDSGK